MKNMTKAQKIVALCFAAIPATTLLLALVVLCGIPLADGDLDARFFWLWGGMIMAECHFLWGLYDSIFAKQKLNAAPLGMNIFSICLGSVYFAIFGETNPESFIYNFQIPYTIFCIIFLVILVVSKLRKDNQ